jgi:hypothetical protein
VNVRTNPVGGSFAVDTIVYTTTQQFTWVSGSSHTIETTSPQNAGPGIRWVWKQWSDNGAISHVVAPTANTNYQALFGKQYLLTMNAGSGGTVQPATGWHNAGSTGTIKATPNLGFTFSNWTGSGPGSFTGTNNPASVQMNGPVTETATFNP